LSDTQVYEPYIRALLGDRFAVIGEQLILCPRWLAWKAFRQAAKDEVRELQALVAPKSPQRV